MLIYIVVYEEGRQKYGIALLIDQTGFLFSLIEFKKAMVIISSFMMR